MSYTDPKRVILLVSDPDPINPFLNMQRIRIDHTVRWLEQVCQQGYRVDQSILMDVRGYLKEYTGLDIHPVVIENMFMLYPIEASSVDDIGSTDARDSLLDIVSHFYLNSWWPAFGDGVEEDKWIETLKKGFEHMHHAPG